MTINFNIISLAVDRWLHSVYVKYNRLDAKLSRMITPIFT